MTSMVSVSQYDFNCIADAASSQSDMEAQNGTCKDEARYSRINAIVLSR